MNCRQICIDFFLVVSSTLLFSCHTNKTPAQPREKHWIEIGLAGEGMMYLDAVNNQEVMQEKVGGDTATQFYSFLVGFQDSVLTTDDKKELAKGKYYQYEMYKNWVALVNGDSIAPVFYQPKTKRYKQTEEGILVFEFPRNIKPDTLVYKDSYGPWGVQRIALNQ